MFYICHVVHTYQENGFASFLSYASGVIHPDRCATVGGWLFIFKKMSNQSHYYRNKEQINEIDPDSLWKLTDEKLVLVDEDQYVSLPFISRKNEFYEVNVEQA